MTDPLKTFYGHVIEIPPPDSIVIDMTKLDEICERAAGRSLPRALRGRHGHGED